MISRLVALFLTLVVPALHFPLVAAAESLKRFPIATYEGIISQRGWSKSPESYCHGGSEFYVLKTASGTFAIGSDRANLKRQYPLDELKKLNGKHVMLLAERVEISKSQEEVCPDPGMQCAGGIYCSFLDVSEIKVPNAASLDNKSLDGGATR